MLPRVLLCLCRRKHVYTLHGPGGQGRENWIHLDHRKAKLAKRRPGRASSGVAGQWDKLGSCHESWWGDASPESEQRLQSWRPSLVCFGQTAAEAPPPSHYLTPTNLAFYYNVIRVCVLRCSVRPSSFATPWMVAHHVPLSMGFPRQEYWNESPFSSPRDLPDPEIEPVCPALAGRFFTTDSLPGKPRMLYISLQIQILLCDPTRIYSVLTKCPELVSHQRWRDEWKRCFCPSLRSSN